MTRALISVSDKTGIVDFAKGLIANNIEIISTGGTKKALDQAGVKTISIDEVTGFPEMMDGRVKTLHPKIHGGLLGRRDVVEHMEDMARGEILPIDFVCVNLYPFKETILKPEVTEQEAIENIDIGGPSMLRSGAKNHEFVTVIVDPADYSLVLQELEAHGETQLATRKRLAAKVFRHTAAYDALIAQYLTEMVDEREPEKLTLTYERKQDLRYGENSHQEAAFYQSALPEEYSIAAAKQVHGKELSFNNIRDADAALRIAREYDEPTVVALKHMNPCGIGTASTIFEAWNYAFEADPVSIFGGIIVLNREVDVATAEKMHELFLEIIIAPGFTEAALEVLKKKKNLRILTISFEQRTASIVDETVSVLGGLLVQNQDLAMEHEEDWTVVTEKKPTVEQIEALAFAWKAVKHVKSNAIVVANEHQTVGIGAGQMNRVGSVKIAIEQAGEKLEGAVLASDAFFPMDDSVEYAATHGIKAIIQPGGSIKDQASIDMANQYGIAMIFTNVRHFRH
ncbi:bifunctional phosphoribosylaminoimidazolecarboxamide formyltransferase/IMP cyclohydrolase [Enterococcus thailandicus]|uniref:bifunctional phosphoribosylaminoimidazolecarboxamide formyltransferase/IMP cyclohydrolase n=1 Tax=Enterococcus thailandicus TaxID=417368 RepID=UPI0022EBF0C4|nr:bifunctional phosphoribosylaminoimidazolecarboxamide formyltransferase/IMP cyclohydrolase [Enterococcus thailandicus]MDA3973609.1 bifunctional phosphoribosylaminoimidazolecarboxamide formyltransferase/IMP cyclohydrolase [Enterococcus thailandicus]MDA3975806.1 bifunctional phosphoribosylaminoimidazolecarboxamide formyltransferase/IMP cyclohydrolase [Enterococcus thailandicus]MDA3981068.1 bifunctional phosphoribosylaminoimidazolecarboxamide formyltransferase/IMP cyclohydrolase [Enterococcus tha